MGLFAGGYRGRLIGGEIRYLNPYAINSFIVGHRFHSHGAGFLPEKNFREGDNRPFFEDNRPCFFCFFF